MIGRTRTLAGAKGLLATTLLAVSAAGCAPTVHVDVKPITIYAKLDADVRVKLDEDVKALIQQHPNLF